MKLEQGTGATTADLGVVHVDMERLDGLLNLVGELVINRATLLEHTRRARNTFGFKEQVLELIETNEKVGRIGEEIQSKIIKARMVPVGNIFHRFTRMVERLSELMHKQLRLQINGGSTEIDKKVIDALAEPLVHLVRNACDHGIEPPDVRERLGKPRQGSITLNAYHEGNFLIIEVQDDGAGIDGEKVKRAAVEKGLLTSQQAAALSRRESQELIFHAHFSTASKVTGISGRGVGMDTARRRIEIMGGDLQLRSQVGQGCTVRISIPLTMAIIQALVVSLGDEVYAVPLESICEIIRARQADIATIENQEVLELRGAPLSLLRLAEVLDLPDAHTPDQFTVVVVNVAQQQIGLVLDRVLGKQEIVIKPMGRRLANIFGISGASIGGDGRVLLILDMAALDDKRAVDAQ